MYLKIISAFLLLFVFSCAKPDPKDQMQNLQGYWEIRSVEMPSGKNKHFDLSTIVDHIQLKGDSGIRTKVSPNLDGTFTTNGDSENFVLKIEDDSLRMYYKTPYDEWKETVIKAEDSTFTVKNRDNKIYKYVKFKKFDLGE
ncbi:hypothetical protein EI546_16045 [Aequorivita sp. H23M31]|uniref:Lipocalin-like domain-containing protein n=1 Tax=Aequorivita ciconiae TaxID=2494375 RepID=A0A410G785_9FLAO|nr:lipocalin family protein [Aequorivita sp. H23M31]QAA83126.1 hypothetical protein EI546_16045 [Aequorivita sp. H23M31]